LGVEIHAEQLARLHLVVGDQGQELVVVGVERGHGGGSITGLPGRKQTGVSMRARLAEQAPGRPAMPMDAVLDYRTIEVTPQPSGFGAQIAGVDLTRPVPEPVLAEVKAAWARHAVVAFPDQPLASTPWRPSPCRWAASATIP